MTPELRELALRQLHEGQSITAVAQAIGKSRQSLYRAAARDPELARAMRLHRDDDDDPAPWPQEHFDSRPGLTPWPETLTADQVAEFTKTLRKTKRIVAAARAAGIDMHPNRVSPSELSPAKRQVLRDALDKLRQPDVDPVAPTREAFERWLQNSEDWPMETDDIDIDELRKLSPRAAAHFEATVHSRARVLARAGRSRPKPPDEPWEEF